MKSDLASEIIARPETKHAYAIRNGVLCALAVAVALFATYPVADLGIVDDWSYIKTALDFARTGHFIFNGWATTMLGWQVILGAAFIKVFGFSFTVVRSSLWLLALASVFLFHQILLRFGIRPANAVFGALMLGLSPIFVPLAVTFMSDIPSLLVILLCIYMCQRAIAADTDRSALLWLCSATLINVAGGTARQVAWLGFLVMVPSTAWLLRRRRGVLPAAFLMWAVGFIAILGVLHWFNQQPYTVSDNAFISAPISRAMAFSLPLLLVKTLLCMTLVLLPLFSAAFPVVGELSLRARARVGFLMLAVVLIYVFLRSRGTLEHALMPWIFNTIGAQGIVPAHMGYMLGSPPVTLGLGMRVAISLIVVAADLIFVEWAISRRSFPGPIENRLKIKDSSWREIAWILGPYALTYVGLLLPRAIHGFIFDRYLLLLLPAAIIVLLKFFQEKGGMEPGVIGWIVLSVFALYTVADTHDWFALDRARLAAAGRILALGIPRTAIQGGFEYDGWTQIQNGGHINQAFIRVPKGAYDPNVPPLPLAPDCSFPFSMNTPAIKPKYFLTYERKDCLAPSELPAVPYRAWLPPFHRTVYIQQLPPNAK